MKQTTLLFTAALIATTAFAQPALKQQRVYGGAGSEGLRRLCITKDSGILIGGSSQSDISGNKTTANKGEKDFWLIKQDKNGKKKWEQSIGGSVGDYLTDVKATSDGGYIIAGYSYSGISGDKTENNKGSADYWVVKLNGAGKVLWDKTLGGNGDDFAYSVEETTDSGFIVAGNSASKKSGNKSENVSGFSDVWIVKLGKSGKLQWQNTIGGTGYDGKTYDNNNGQVNNLHPVVCRQTPDGGYIIGTVSSSYASGDKTENGYGGGSDYWVVKTNSVGNVVWDKTIGGVGADYLNALTLTADGGYIASGYSNSPVSGNKTAAGKGGYDYWVVKINSAGTIEWDKTIGGDGLDALQSVEQTADGGYILGGYSASGKSGDKSGLNKGLYDYWMVKINSAGAKQWDKTIGGSDYDYCLDVKETAPNIYYAGGTSYSDTSGDKTLPSYGDSDDWLVKLIYNNAALGSETITGNRMKIMDEMLNEKTFSIHPNPATAVLHIQSSSKATYVLSDEHGRKILTKTIDGSGEINVAALSPGMYYLRNTTTGETQKAVIIK